MAIQCRSPQWPMVAGTDCVVPRLALGSVWCNRKYKIHMITFNTITTCTCSYCVFNFLNHFLLTVFLLEKHALK